MARLLSSFNHFNSRQMMFWILLSALFLLYGQNANAQASKSEIRMTDEGYRIFFNGEPFYVNGAGVDKGDLESLASHGANAFKTWSTENGETILDQAHQLGLTVMMGIWVGLERHGFDYNDEVAVKDQLDRIRKRVMALKDHPALLLWGIGNELNLQSKNPRVWDAVNDIAKMIHEIDPNHLTTTALAGIDKELASVVSKRAPEVDFLSIQLYGPMDVLPQILNASKHKGPLLITEWGATGYWEVPKTEWGAPVENHSSKKADLYLSRYQNSIASQASQVMGSFVFLWGQKQERTPTWFGMFMPSGNETESVDVMHYVWKGKWPKNRSPRLEDFALEGQRNGENIRLKAGAFYSAEVKATDPDGDALSYLWEIRNESTSTKSGGDAEYVPAVIEGLFPENGDRGATFYAPKKAGAYRLFIYVDDGQSHTAHANIPFWVGQ